MQLFKQFLVVASKPITNGLKLAQASKKERRLVL